MAFYAGDLNQYITIERVKAHTVDTYGRPGKTWEFVCALYAQVSDVSGREYYAAAAYQMEDVVTFTTRYVGCVTPNMRVLFNGEIYEITEVNHLRYKGDFMSLKTRKVEAEANG